MSFDASIAFVLEHEGGYQCRRDDPGNWTGGKIGVGELKGTNMGISAACLSPDVRVLTADLRWVRGDDLKVGEEIIGFEPHPRRGQRLCRATVDAIGPVVLDAMRVVTDRGEVVASTNHLWLRSDHRGTSRVYAWRPTFLLRPGDLLSYWMAPWEVAVGRDAGYVAAILDGEGFCSRGTNTRRVGWTQLPGPVVDEMRRITAEAGIAWTSEAVRQQRQNGLLDFTWSAADSVRLLGMFRPVRLLPKSARLWEGSQPFKRAIGSARVLSVEPLGVREVVGLATSSGTFIGDGFLTHNSYPDEDIKNLTRERALFLYERDFWKAMKCDQMGPRTALAVLDGGVNEGTGWAPRALQEELGVAADGVVGPETLEALRKRDDFALAKRFLMRRVLRYAALPNWRTDADEWTLRVIDLAMLLPTLS